MVIGFELGVQTDLYRSERVPLMAEMQAQEIETQVGFRCAVYFDGRRDEAPLAIVELTPSP